LITWLIKSPDKLFHPVLRVALAGVLQFLWKIGRL